MPRPACSPSHGMTPDVDPAFSCCSYLSARNIPYLNLMSLDNLNCRDILRAKKVVISQSAMAVLKDRYGAD